MDSTTKTEIKNAVVDFFHKLDVPMTVAEINKELHAATREKIRQLGYPLDDAATNKAFEPYLIVGAGMIAVVYPRKRESDTELRTYMAAFNSLFIACDDVFAEDPDRISIFNNRFVQGLPQDDPLLEACARCLQELPKYWDPIMADMLRQSTMAFMTSLAIEYRLKDAEMLSGGDTQLARSLRDMTAAGMLYALWMFPPNSAPEIYLPALPSMNTFVCLSNDILSFYKEELAHENMNYLSICARSNGTTKLAELKKAVDECTESYRQVERLVSGHPDVNGSVLGGLSGILRHHLSVPRYRLVELLEICH